MSPEQYKKELNQSIPAFIQGQFEFNASLGVPKSLLHCGLNNFIGERPTTTPGFICGPVGCGKSHLAVGFLRQEIFTGVANSDPHLNPFNIDTMGFISTWRFIQKMKEFDTAAKTLEYYQQCDFLVLDDLGTTRPTDFVMDVLPTLILARQEDEKKTLITSNLTIEEIAKLYGERVASRIVSFGEVVKLSGKDGRIK
jgi:DNA replication protein DnaC